MKKIILFGPLFTQAERIWNRLLKEAMEKEGAAEFEVILPQKEAAKFQHISDEALRLKFIIEKCLENASSLDVAVVILDGADTDSGTCFRDKYPPF